MCGLESKGDHSQRTLSNLLRREKIGHLFPEKQWRFMGNNIKHSPGSEEVVCASPSLLSSFP